MRKRTPHRPSCHAVALGFVVLTTALLGMAQDTAPAIETPDFDELTAWDVVSVQDDGVIALEAGDRELKVELAGVKTLATDGTRANLCRFLTNLLEGEQVYVSPEPSDDEATTTEHPAQLYRAPDGLHVNLETVRQGYAKVDGKTAGEQAKTLRFYERRAKKARKGVWAPRSKTAASEGSSQSTAKKPTPTDADQIIVYVTKSGKKYHREDCYHLRKSATPITLAEAIAKGYQPCSHCDPPTLDDP